LEVAFPFSFSSINLLSHQISMKPLFKSKQTPGGAPSSARL
jgi:hypothetical protein